ncbi:MAG: hypothetical protein AAGB19_00175 [Cyanobacteria bacterium P01_F01_bin.3]
MTFLDMLAHFLVNRFPYWGACGLSFHPAHNTLGLHCQTRHNRDAIIRDRAKLARLDIGLQKIVVMHPDHPDFIIEMGSFVE